MFYVATAVGLATFSTVAFVEHKDNDTKMKTTLAAAFIVLVNMILFYMIGSIASGKIK